jgi:O-acetyl-ADP-ribose deacetylase (regulator of RNase III)
MGSGLAKAIRERWPEVYDLYVTKLSWNLGEVQLVSVAGDFYVANLAGQFDYGRDKQHTDYGALERALYKVYNIAGILELPLYIPYGIGCGLGGGDWSRVAEIIDGIAPRAIVCKYEA